MIIIEGNMILWLRGQFLERVGASVQPHTSSDLEKITLPPCSNLLNGYNGSTYLTGCRN